MTRWSWSGWRRSTNQHSGHQGIISKPALASPFSVQPKKNIKLLQTGFSEWHWQTLESTWPRKNDTLIIRVYVSVLVLQRSFFFLWYNSTAFSKHLAFSIPSRHALYIVLAAREFLVWFFSFHCCVNMCRRKETSTHIAVYFAWCLEEAVYWFIYGIHSCVILLHAWKKLSWKFVVLCLNDMSFPCHIWFSHLKECPDWADLCAFIL